MLRSDARHNRKQIMDAFHLATRQEIIALPTMSEIVKLSGLGRGTVYRHFPDIGALSFSFMSEGYEALFAESRENLRQATSSDQSLKALADHLKRYRAFTLENLALLTTPECMTSDGYALAHRSQRQCVRRAIRDMAGLGKASPPLLDSMVDIISRVAEPEHLKAAGLKQGAADPLAEQAIQTLLGFAKELALTLTP
jgi:AcrR family transcriptional regulator